MSNYNLQFAQIAWVTKDIHATIKFFRETLGISGFNEPQLMKLKDYDSTYYGEKCDAEDLLSMTYNGGTFIELIQPLTGRTIFSDYLDQNPGGGIQHVAFRVPIKDLDKVVKELSDKGYRTVSTFDTPIAKIIFFDTTKEIGIHTEIMGITEEGEKAIEEMKKNLSHD